MTPIDDRRPANGKSAQEDTDDREERARARTARLLALIFGGLIVVLIAIMMGIDLYAENLEQHGHDAPSDAAVR